MPEQFYWFVAGISVAAIVIVALVWRSVNRVMRRGLVFSDK